MTSYHHWRLIDQSEQVTEGEYPEDDARDA
jgi:hypothetical protein